MEQSSLFDVPPSGLPACASCGEPFVPGINGAGTKYCSTPCKQEGYNRGYRQPARPPREKKACIRCGAYFIPRNPMHVYCNPKCRPRFVDACAWCNTTPIDGWIRRSGIWPYICNECLHPIRHVVARLRSHRVSHERARLLLTDPTCEVCGIDIVKLMPRTVGGGGVSSLLTVDHDHGCCPGYKSCGKCVRGLLCVRCNAAEGQLQGDAARARALADYIERAGNQSTK